MVKKYSPRLHHFNDDRAPIATMEPYILGNYVTAADYDRLKDTVERISNAYGALPAGKKKATPAVQLAVNAYLNLRNERSDGDQ
jgi:hemerythrin-like domain-containing protein